MLKSHKYIDSIDLNFFCLEIAHVHAYHACMQYNSSSQVRKLTQEQKDLIKDLQSPSDLPVQERRMFYAALDRRMTDGTGLPAGAVAKYHAAAGNHKKKLLGWKFYLASAIMYYIYIHIYIYFCLYI